MKMKENANLLFDITIEIYLYHFGLIMQILTQIELFSRFI